MDDSAAAATTSSSPISLDLNVNLLPKLEPKQEPLDDSYSPLPLRHSSSEDTKKLFQHLSPKLEDEDSLFSEYYRLAHLFLSLTSTSTSTTPPPPPSPSQHSKSIVPARPPSSPPSALVPAPPGHKHRPRSAEMVRVSVTGPADQRHFRELVRRTRSTFESLRLLFSLHDERSCCSASPLGRRCRPDLKSAGLMTARSLWINRDRRIVGPIPGVLVGDVFFFRIELCVVGLHGQVQGGIDYVPASRAPTREPIATSIVLSGGYEDDEDSGNVIIYTGHGGRDHNAHRHSLDQRLEGGNLALERSMAYGVEIRVIRGFRFDGSPAGKVYVYDGLYRVVDFWKDVGRSGFAVYKYRIVRIAGQFEMGSVVLRFAEEMKDRLTSKPQPPHGYLTHDISYGKEHVPVGLFNDIDNDREPMLFDYVARLVYPHSLLLRGDIGGGGCCCVTNCSAENGCSCALRNGGDFPYDTKGVLVMGKPLIYECGSFCSCPPSCRNRVSQKGVRSRLEVFRSRETGWGVRSLDLIRAGTFVCEYSGIVLTEQQTELLSMNGGSLVYPKRFPNRWFEWGDVSNVDPGYQRPMFPSPPNVKFSLDVSRLRNVACYLSHSCSPNVFPQLVLYDHYDEYYPHLMIFAMENIPPYRELSIDYGIGDGWMVNVDP